MRFSVVTIFCILLLGNAGVNAEQSFTLPALNKPTNVDLRDYRGKIVLLDFWASWCAPCLKSLPIYQTWNEQNKIAVVSVNVDDLSEDAMVMIEKLNLKFPVAYDKEKSVARAFNVFALPVAFILSPQGNILMRHEGFTSGDAEKLSILIDSISEASL